MYFAIILAGGVGSRAGGSLPKQFQDIAGVPMLLRSIRAIRDALPQAAFVVVAHPDHHDRCIELISSAPDLQGLPYVVTDGGNSRVGSVINGLDVITMSHIPTSEDIVLIHDAARPLVSAAVIEDALKLVGKGCGVVPAVPLSDSIRRVKDGATQSARRSDFVAVQTPQVFLLEDIVRAYGEVKDESLFTDDASVGEAAGLKILISKGDPSNIKITNPVDFLIAEQLVGK